MLQHILITALLLLPAVGAGDDPVPTLYRTYRETDPRLRCDSPLCSKLGTIRCFAIPSTLSPLHYKSYWWRCRLNELQNHIVNVHMEDDYNTLHVDITPKRVQNTALDIIDFAWRCIFLYTYPQFAIGVLLGQWIHTNSIPRKIELSYWI